MSDLDDKALDEMITRYSKLLPWSYAGLAMLLRFGRKSSGGWDDEVADGEYMPDDGDAEAIMALRTDNATLIDAVRKARAEHDAATQGQMLLIAAAKDEINHLSAQIAAVRALQRYFVAFANDATPAVNGSYVFYEDLIRALDGDGAAKGESSDV